MWWLYAQCSLSPVYPPEVVCDFLCSSFQEPGREEALVLQLREKDELILQLQAELVRCTL
jgi:hypothetical protein